MESYDKVAGAMDGFATPANHVDFKAKRLFGRVDGVIADGAVAILQPSGGGPVEKHRHSHDHLFMVISGEARIEFEDETVIVPAYSAYRVDGSRLHSVWNNTDQPTVMVGCTLIRDRDHGQRSENGNND
ncbi:MAG: cupin domain-containing protein [Succinivibrionaceae bacterium]|nr:cupin domain-containing protein [Succinivibrionaceae bacterium]